MAARRPLVLVGGKPAELPLGDTIDPSDNGLTRFRSGFYYRSRSGAPLQVDTHPANSLRLAPFILGKPQSFTRCGIEVTNASALATGIIGIYNDDGNGYPTTLVSAGIPAISAATQGFKESIFTASVALAPGLYWLALLVTGAQASFRALSGGLAPLPTITTGVDGNNGYEVTGQATLPATFPANGALITNAPALALRAA